MTKQPDRWERKVLRNRLAYTLGFSRTKIITCADAAKLLRKEHKAVVRMVQDYARVNALLATIDRKIKAGYAVACDNILRKLNERAK